MYKVMCGISSGNNLTVSFVSLSEAMDWADRMHTEGFYFAEVTDEYRKLLYTVDDWRPRSVPERDQRQRMAKAFLRKVQAQEEAYATYAPNLQTTRELDEIFGSAPGYLKLSHVR